MSVRPKKQKLVYNDDYSEYTFLSYFDHMIFEIHVYILGLMGTNESNAFLGTDNFHFQPNISNNKTPKNYLAIK